MDNYNYFQTWELQLITNFLFNETPLEICRNKVAITHVEPRVNELQSVLLGISNIKFKGGKHLFKCSSHLNTVITIELDKENNINSTYIKSQLREYIQAYKNNELKDERQRFSYEYELTSFCKLFKKGYNLKDFKLKDWKHLPVILVGYFEGLINIKNVYVSLPKIGESVDDDINAIKNLVGEDLSEVIFEDDFLDFNCDLDVTKFARKYLHKKKNLSKKNTYKKLKYTNQQQKMYDLIVKMVKNEETEVTTADFYEFIRDSDDIPNDKKRNAVSQAIKRLNSKYQEINNTQNKILKLSNEKSFTYKITDSFINFVESHYDNAMTNL